jgi:hypothetical protein
MGTSTSYSAPKTPQWARAKATMTRFANQGGVGPTNVANVMSDYVVAHGGAKRATSTFAGRSAAQKLGGFLSTMSRDGISEALREIGLEDLVGKDASTILYTLTDRIAGAANTLDEVIARRATIEILTEILENAESEDEIDELYGQGLSQERIEELLERFISLSIYERLLQELGDRIDDASVTTGEKRKTEDLIKDFVEQNTRVHFGGTDVLSLDWEGDTGKALVDMLFEEAYNVFVEL